MRLDSGSARKSAHPGMTGELVGWVEHSEPDVLIRGKSDRFRTSSTHPTGCFASRQCPMFLQSQRAGHAGIASCTESTSARAKGKAPRRVKPVLASARHRAAPPGRHAYRGGAAPGPRLVHLRQGGDAVAELARIAAQRLQIVEDTWKKVLEARRRERS
ncbi:MAG: hypothetical protein QOJ84_5483 [Bradyrhizobium sp.]|jgi:hypothetical protein|nr:hypothetical protein [Bradyrhizobium sp.]